MCDYILTTKDRYGVEYTEDECMSERIQFNQMYYCRFQHAFGDAKIYVFFPCGMFMMFFFMRLLSTTADEYLSPSLEYMTIKFGISESLAGVTILAFGNGAPDLFTSMSAGSDNAVITMSPLLGSALFISSCVVCLSTYASKPDNKIKVTSSLFLRDITLFIFMDLYLLTILFFIENITYLIACSFALIYFSYVVVVVI
jgi:sodium/potassium/calcium exchanger 6